MPTMQQIQQELECYRKVFTTARLVNAEEIRAHSIEHDGKTEIECPFRASPRGCKRCKYCVVCQALLEKTKKNKLEYSDDDVLQVTAKYELVDGEEYVLELIQTLDKDALIDPESSENLVEKLLPYRERLFRDAATGAYNRRFYEEKIKDSTIHAGVAVMDLDDFKLFNDTLGHHAGDVALQTIVQIAQRGIRKSDALIRYGGDEFLLILPNISEQVFSKKLELLCEQIRAAVVPNNPSMQLSVSIGAAIARGERIDAAIRRADRMMYRAKSHRNMVITEWQNESVPLAQPKHQKVLIVDDSELNRALLAEILSSDYEIIEAENGAAGMEVLRQYKTDISAVLLDIVMPVMDGFTMLKAMTQENMIEDIPVIMISSADSEDVIRDAFDLGIADYINRPFDTKIVYRRVFNAIKLYAKQRRLISIITDQVNEKEKNNHMMINILSQTVEFRNGESGMHVLHMQELTEHILTSLVQRTDKYQLTVADRDRIATASALHDIGKIAVDEKILNKPGKLTRAEFEIMKTHTICGAEILDCLGIYRNEPLVRTAHDICRWHHERYDGRGYPDGLKGDEIPISAQAVALADVYDALVSERVYKKAIPHEKAVQMILNGECGAFNPLLMDCLRSIADTLPQLEFSPNRPVSAAEVRALI